MIKCYESEHMKLPLMKAKYMANLRDRKRDLTLMKEMKP